MRNLTCLASLMMGLLIFSGCDDTSLPKYSDLSGLRVLAIKDDASGYSEVSPGSTVAITPYVSDFGGGTRALTYQAVACLDPGISTGVEPSCTGVPGASTVASGTVTITGSLRTGSATAFTVTVPSTILTGRTTQDQYNGVNYLVTYTISSSTGDSVRAFKRILVSDPSKTTKNKNPTLSGLLANGVAITSMPTSGVELSVSYSADSLETYNYKNTDLTVSTVSEELVTTWFISTGTLKYFRTVKTESTTFTPPTMVAKVAKSVCVAS